MIKAIIFDLDGTLVDTPSTGSKELEAFSIAKGLPSHDYQKMRMHYGHHDTEDLGWSVPLAQQKDLLVEWGEWSKTHIMAHEHLQPPLYAGILDMLVLVKGRADIFLATSREGHTANFLLDKYQLDHFFTAQRTQCCVKKFELKDKPAPDMLLHLMAAEKLEPHQVIMVGDTTFDIHMAQAANVKSIAITHGAHDVTRLQAANPNYLVHNVPELEVLLDKLLVR